MVIYTYYEYFTTYPSVRPRQGVIVDSRPILLQHYTFISFLNLHNVNVALACSDPRHQFSIVLPVCCLPRVQDIRLVPNLSSLCRMTATTIIIILY